MTSIDGLSLDDQCEILEETLEKKKELKKLRDEIKEEVLRELEKEYDFKTFKEFKTQFDEFLTLLEEHLQTGSKESKKAILDKIPIVKDVNKW
ncbi:hypothetical protein KAH94_06200 [bacterium]|nr:hypothetical protein [bacterium]